jgi:hypothetical protein
MSLTREALEQALVDVSFTFTPANVIVERLVVRSFPDTPVELINTPTTRVRQFIAHYQTVAWALDQLTALLEYTWELDDAGRIVFSER